MLDKTHNYVQNTWEKAKVEITAKKGEKYWLPCPFVPPCVTGYFRVLFYWDTFYTNKGLIADGFIDLAKNNVDNLLYMLDKLGFVPNSWSDSGTKWCSQPPYLHFMVRDIYEQTKDVEWLKSAYFSLKKEYEFWMKDRMTETGLNRHYHLPLTQDDLVYYYDYIGTNRIKIPMDIPAEEKAEIAHGYVASGEAGLDYSPRFRTFGDDIIPVDLNANLYGLESDLAEWSEMFEPEKTGFYKIAMKNRKALMDKYCLGNDGLYHDYNYLTKTQNTFVFSGQFMPFITGMLSGEELVKKVMLVLENNHGVTSTEKDNEEGHIPYQWSYPNSWAPDNYLCVTALEKNGLMDDAKRVALKFINNIAKTYQETGILWEKYDGVDGGYAKKNEYAVTEMLGWSGGVFSYFYKKYMGYK
ncbi:MAG: hypothetical protein J6U92_07130 [Clostridia bacterium]|nr:hypothetical protein [Clostridia bacterium]